jgi:hypothetical protein
MARKRYQQRRRSVRWFGRALIDEQSHVGVLARGLGISQRDRSRGASVGQLAVEQPSASPNERGASTRSGNKSFRPGS